MRDAGSIAVALVMENSKSKEPETNIAFDFYTFSSGWGPIIEPAFMWDKKKNWVRGWRRLTSIDTDLATVFLFCFLLHHKPLAPIGFMEAKPLARHLA